jgi:hypothetical protein
LPFLGLRISATDLAVHPGRNVFDHLAWSGHELGVNPFAGSGFQSQLRSNGVRIR